jgi:hypothetical protein
MRRVVAQRKRDRDRRAHLVSQDEVVYAGDCPAISDDRIQLFRNAAQLADMSSVVVRLLMLREL